MSTETCNTVKIATDSGVVIINESDYNPEVHKLAEDEVAKVEEPEAAVPQAEVSDAPVQPWAK